MSNVARVGEIFSAAGTAFSRLAEITALMNVVDVHNSASGISSENGAKWDEDDIAQLHASVKKFSEDLDLLTERIKAKTNQQAKAAIKKKIQETSGIPLQSNPAGGDGF